MSEQVVIEQILIAAKRGDSLHSYSSDELRAARDWQHIQSGWPKGDVLGLPDLGGRALDNINAEMIRRGEEPKA